MKDNTSNHELRTFAIVIHNGHPSKINPDLTCLTLQRGHVLTYLSDNKQSRLEQTSTPKPQIKLQCVTDLPLLSAQCDGIHTPSD